MAGKVEIVTKTTGTKSHWMYDQARVITPQFLGLGGAVFSWT